MTRIGDGGVYAVCGMPGVGKTTFAVQAATQARARFPDGQLYLDLHGAGEQALSAEQALGFLLRSLLGPGAVIPAAADERSALLRTTLAGRRVLILLDNARDDAQVRPLVPAGPGCAVLVTSRNVLAGLDARHRVSLGALSGADSAELLTRLAGPGRVQADPDSAAELLRWCGGLPLAIRIVAMRLAVRPGWPAADLAQRLACPAYRLGELAVGDLAVRAAFQDSYRMLAGPERQLFGRLGLLPGPDSMLLPRPSWSACPATPGRCWRRWLTPACSGRQGCRTGIACTACSGFSRLSRPAWDPGASPALERLFNWYLRAVERRAPRCRPDPLGRDGADTPARPPLSRRPAPDSNTAKGL